MKKFVCSLVTIFAMYVAQASYLYWQVDQSDFSSVYSGNDAHGATLYASIGGSSRAVGGALVGQTTAFDLGNSSWDNYSFYVEVARSDGSVVATSEGGAENYANLGAYIGSTSELSTVPMAQVWHGGAMAAPEPTSGFLMMVGLALLGLKRRKV